MSNYIYFETLTWSDIFVGVLLCMIFVIVIEFIRNRKEKKKELVE